MFIIEAHSDAVLNPILLLSVNGGGIKLVIYGSIYFIFFIARPPPPLRSGDKNIHKRRGDDIAMTQL